MENRNSNWWAGFFCGLTVELQQRFANPKQNEREASFLEKVLRVRPNDLIADLPCGDGRLTIELASRGYRTTGVDISDRLVKAARDSAERTHVEASFEVGDMKELTWQSELDGAFCMGNSFAYFDDAGNRQFVEKVYRALKPGKIFLLQTNLVMESILTKPLSRTWYEFGDILFCHSASYDPTHSILTSEYRFSKQDTEERRTAHYRIYTLRDLLELVRSVGFRRADALGGFTGEAYRLGDPSLYLVCEK